MPLSPGEMIAAVKANMLEKTGKTFEAWVKIAKASGPVKHWLGEAYTQNA